jgi:hypothetical protein
MEVGGQRHALAALFPGMTRYQLCRRMDGPQGRSGRVRKISHPPGLDPRTVQTGPSRYTDYAVPAHTKASVPEDNHVDLISYLMFIVAQLDESPQSEQNSYRCCVLYLADEARIGCTVLVRH